MRPRVLLGIFPRRLCSASLTRLMVLYRRRGSSARAHHWWPLAQRRAWRPEAFDKLRQCRVSCRLPSPKFVAGGISFASGRSRLGFSPQEVLPVGISASSMGLGFRSRSARVGPDRLKIRRIVLPCQDPSWTQLLLPNLSADLTSRGVPDISPLQLTAPRDIPEAFLWRLAGEAPAAC